MTKPPVVDYTTLPGPEGGSILTSRGAAVLAGALVFALVAALYAQSSWLSVVALWCGDGLLAVLWMAAAAGWGVWLLQACGAGVSGMLGAVTAAALGLGFESLAALGLGLAGGLNRTTATALPLLGAAAGIAWLMRHCSRQPVPAGRWLRQPAGWNWLWVAAAAALAMCAVGACLLPGILWRPDDPHPYDVLEYHLQVPREWYEAGRIIPLDHNVFSYFPFNAEMQYLLAMYVRGGPWAAMYLAQFINVATMTLAALAVYGGVKALRPQARGAAVVAAVAFALTPWVPMLAPVAYDESALLLFTALAVCWALRAVGPLTPSPGTPGEGGGEGRLLVVAAVLAGLACGVKYTAVPMLLLGIPLALIVAVPRAWTSAIKFAVIGALVFSPWMVRNAAWTGNPVFPLAMRVLGQGHFTDAQVARFDAAHTLPPDHRSLARLGSEVLWNWQYGYVLWAAALAAALLAWRSRQTRFLIVLLLAMIVVWMGFTHLISRFLVMAIPVAAVLIGIAPWGRLTAAVAALVLLVGGIVACAQVHPRLAAFAHMGQSGLFGLTDVRLLQSGSPELVAAEAGPDQIALIGDAQPFLYSVPMSRLSYRTVFDLRGGGFPDAWLPDGENAPRAGRVLVISPDEVQRLAKTYQNVPALPPDMAGPEHIFLRR